MFGIAKKKLEAPGWDVKDKGDHYAAIGTAPDTRGNIMMIKKDKIAKLEKAFGPKSQHVAFHVRAGRVVREYLRRVRNIGRRG